MPLSLNEIKDRALAFSREWEGARAERAEAQTFWNEFFAVFGISRRTLNGWHSSLSCTTSTQAFCLPLRSRNSAREKRVRW